MKTKSAFFCISPLKILLFSLALGGCSSVSNIVPQLPNDGSANSTSFVGQDIQIANDLLTVGNKRGAADAYFRASQNYRSPERERLILQAAELSASFNDVVLTQQYLSPLSFEQLSPENQARFRLIQSQLALNDRNFREALRILPQRVNNIPQELGQKILKARMNAAQSSGDKLALVQELVLQETTLTASHQVSLNHDRIWSHAQQIPAFQLNEAKNSINHPTVKNWLSLAQLSRTAKNGPASKRQSLRGDLGFWIQNNPSHPGMSKALGLLNSSPTTTVTPYPVATKPVVRPPPVRVVSRPPVKVIPKAPVRKVVTPKPIVKPKPVIPAKAGPSAYDLIKKQLDLP